MSCILCLDWRKLLTWLSLGYHAPDKTQDVLFHHVVVIMTELSYIIGLGLILFSLMITLASFNSCDWWTNSRYMSWLIFGCYKVKFSIMARRIIERVIWNCFLKGKKNKTENFDELADLDIHNYYLQQKEKKRKENTSIYFLMMW